MTGLLRFDSIDEAVAFARDRAVAMVDLKFCDLWGRWHHVTLPARRLTPALLERGVGFDGSALGVKSVKAGDMVLLPDLGAAFLDPWCDAPTLSFLCETVEAGTRERSPFDPRGILRRAEAALVASGVADRSVWGPEFEFYLFDAITVENDINVASYRVESAEGEWRRRVAGSGYTVPRRGGYHAVPPHDRLHNARSRMTLALESMGIEVKYHHHEVGGPGQCEIEIPLMPALEAADASMLVKYAIRMTAVSQGLTATFLPKPLHGEAGSGMHFHQCLWRDRVNVFYDRTGYGHLSEAAHRYVGGLLAHGPAVMGLTNPSTNSYRRLVPGFEAPVSAFYSLANRSAAVRIPAYADRPDSTRLEFRPPDGTGNPYLSIAAQLMAGLDGMRRCLEPGPMGFGPVDEDIFAWPAERRAEVRGLPTSLGQALDALDGDRGFLLDGDAFSDDVIDRWIARRRAEERELVSRPHPFEYELYYDL
jgi:glutamine synthetase